jgi:hypothetical protein
MHGTRQPAKCTCVLPLCVLDVCAFVATNGNARLPPWVPAAFSTNHDKPSHDKQNKRMNTEIDTPHSLRPTVGSLNLRLTAPLLYTCINTLLHTCNTHTRLRPMSGRSMTVARTAVSTCTENVYLLRVRTLPVLERVSLTELCAPSSSVRLPNAPSR